mgnify:CR=1 FL=1
MFRPVVVHEFGHSFGGLADEYFYDNDVMTDTYPLDIEPWEQNISTQVDFAAKWKDMLSENTPVPTPAEVSENYPTGVYEGGRLFRRKGSSDRQRIAACAPMNIRLSALCANALFAELLSFIPNKKQILKETCL